MYSLCKKKKKKVAKLQVNVETCPLLMLLSRLHSKKHFKVFLQLDNFIHICLQAQHFPDSAAEALTQLT